MVRCLVTKQYLKNLVLLCLIGLGLTVCGCAAAQVLGNVKVTAVNLNVDYSTTDGYFGPSSQALSTSEFSLFNGQEFTETLTLTNNALLFTHNINSITSATPGFTVLSVQPNLPYTLSKGGSVAITIKMRAPDSEYNGPLNLRISTS